MLINKICNTIIPVIIVLVFFGCASFWAPLKLLFNLCVLIFYIFSHVYFPFLNHHFELWKWARRWALLHLSCIGANPAVMTRTFYFIHLFIISYSTGEVCTFLFKCTPLIF